MLAERVQAERLEHGNEADPIDVTEAGAVMVVQLAAILVGWFKAGYVQTA